MVPQPPRGSNAVGRTALTDLILRQAPILSVSAGGFVLGGAVSLVLGRACWEIFLMALVVLAFSPFVGRA